MDINKKKDKSIKNAEKRRERSKVAARCRRGKESEIFTDLSTSLPISESSKSTLDKASIMRLTLCNLRLKNMLSAGFSGYAKENTQELSNTDFESQMNQALGGFIIVFGLDGDVIYASEGITTHLGISQFEIMGQSIFDFSHQYDYNDIRNMLMVKKGDVDEGSKRSCQFRMKCTVSSRGRNAHLRSANYKVINCVGRMISSEDGSATDENNKKWFISICEPLLHPSDVDIPLNKQSFLSKHTPGMKFEYVDDSVAELLGYKPEEMIGRSLFEFSHAGDGVGIAKAFKSLYDKEQNQTERYRFLTKGGGWIWVMTEATIINGGCNSKTPNSVVCIHFVTSGREEPDQILSEVQIGKPDVLAAAAASLQPQLATADIPRVVLADRSMNKPNNFGPTVHAMNPNEENVFIADLLVGPLFNQATCSTSKIFAPKTKDMDTGFLMPMNDTLVVSKDEPVDLTHLAPIAGDECIPLDVPLLDDLLASLDADDMSYSFLDTDRTFDFEEIPRFSVNEPTSSSTCSPNSSCRSPLMLNIDPLMVSESPTPPLFSPTLYCSTTNLSTTTTSPIKSPQQICLESFSSGMVSPISTDMTIAMSMMKMQPQIGLLQQKEPLEQPSSPGPLLEPQMMFTEDSHVMVSGAKNLPEMILKTQMEPDWNLLQQANDLFLNEIDGETPPKKIQRLLPLSTSGQCEENTRADTSPSYILAPDPGRKRNIKPYAYSGADWEDNRERIDLINLLRSQQLQLNEKTTLNRDLLASIGLLPEVQNALMLNRMRKRNVTGSLLDDRTLCFRELSRQECEVNAPLSQNAVLLQGADLLNALEAVGTTENTI